MPTPTMEVDVAARAKHAATGERTVVSTRLAAICDLIQGYRGAGTSLSASQVATISAMIEDIAATTVTERRMSVRRRKRNMITVGSYEEVCTLGKGRFGVVVRARHRVTGLDVALKSQHYSSGGDGMLQLLREACFMAACRGYPSLVSIHGMARAAGNKRRYSLVMEDVGPNLEQVLVDRGRPFPEADARRMMRQLLDGVVVMHQHGIVHGDIKPGNILVDDGGAMKICDLGLAKSMDEKAAALFIAGSKGYMAPEKLVWNENHDTLADTWSLGCVMAQLLTGKVPFYGNDECEQLYEIFNVVGVPGKRAWQALKAHEYLDDEVQLWRARQRRLGYRNRLRELFPEETLSRDGFEVLKGLLTCDPKKRLTAAAALRCARFTQHNEDEVVHSDDVGGGAIKIKSWSRLWQMAISFAGRALELLRPKRILK